MVSSAFKRAFGQAYTQLSNQRDDDFPLLYYSVEAWCSVLNFDYEVKNHIVENTQVAKDEGVTKAFWDEGTGFTNFGLSEPKLKQILKNIVNQLQIGESTQRKIILILAFGFTAVGYLLYLIDNNQQNQTQNTNSVIRDKTESLPPSAPKETNQVLVLVINVSNSAIVARLKEKRKVDADDCKKLYRATEALWLGSKQNLSPKLAQSFSENNDFVVSSNTESEYNIYLIKIELSDADEGFKASAGQLDRIDAFSRLANLSTDIKVSPRLRVEAYENTGVYSR